MCMGECGTEVTMYRPICKACAKATLEWRKTYDGPAVMSDEGERILVRQCRLALEDDPHNAP